MNFSASVKPSHGIHVQTNQKIRKDTRNVQRDEQDDAVVAPFAGEESLQRPPTAPDPALFAVHGEDVSAEEVLALLERGDEGGVGGEERSVGGGGLGF